MTTIDRMPGARPITNAASGAQLRAAAEPSQPLPTATPPAKQQSAATSQARTGEAAVATRSWVDRASTAQRPVVVAHRGEHDAKAGEHGNDMESLRRATTGGESDVVEADTRVLRDGTIVMFHDATTTRRGQEVALTDLTHAQFQRLHPDAPTLEEWSRDAGRRDANVLIDFKGAGYEAAALEVLQRNIAPEHLAIAAFNTDVLRTFHQLDPSLDLGLFADRPNKDGTVQSLRTQLTELGFTPSFVELDDSNSGAGNLATLRRTDIPVMFAGIELTKQHLNDTSLDVMGVMSNSPGLADTALDRRFGEDDSPMVYAPGRTDWISASAG